MLTSELLKRVRRLELRTARAVDDVIGGAYHSVFKGRGIEFDEVREYTVEDDVRDIDWNVSARLNAPYVKKYVEERELTVLLMVDVSSSTCFGAPGRTKRELACEVAALLGMSALRNNDRVALTLFADRTELFLPPRSGRKHALRVIRELVAAAENRAPRRTDIAGALKDACGVLKKRSVIFLISDLIDSSPELEKALKIANRRHDLVVMRIFDSAELRLPDAAVSCMDAETGEELALLSRRDRARFAADAAAAVEAGRALCRRAGVEAIELECGIDPLAGLIGFFRRRRRTRRRTAPAGQGGDL